MLRKCTKCGQEFEGRHDSLLCRSCASESIHDVIRPRACTRCGITFPGYPGSKFCPSCAAERKKETRKAYLARKKAGEVRPIGSVDVCEKCGSEYTVTGGLQRYCPDCAPEAIAENDREKSRQWNAQNIDYEKQKKERHDAAVNIKCSVCGKLFRPISGGTSTCSPECAKVLSAKLRTKWEHANKDRRKEYQRKRIQAKFDAMTPEELAEHRISINERARENYKKRKEKAKEETNG